MTGGPYRFFRTPTTSRSSSRARAAAGARRLDHRAGLHRRQRGAARPCGSAPRTPRWPRCRRRARRGAAVRDLVVAGGGPVGLATALHAARAGLDVAVREPRAGPVDKACGEGLMPGAVADLADARRRPGRPPVRRHPLRRRRAAGRGRLPARRRPRRAPHRRCTPRCADAVAAAGVKVERAPVDQVAEPRRPRRSSTASRPAPRRRRRPALADPPAARARPAAARGAAASACAATSRSRRGRSYVEVHWARGRRPT